MLDETEIVLVTFPRSGSFFLNNLLLENSSLKVTKTHLPELDKSKRIVTIARNPQDTIVSYLAMLSEYRSEIDYEKTAEQLVLDYVENYKYFNQYCSIVVDFDNLVSNPADTLASILDLFGIAPAKFINTNVNQKDMVNLEHLSSSKSSNNYSKAVEACSNINFADAIMLFEQLQRKSCNGRY